METEVIDAPSQAFTPRFAGFWIRFGAAAIDVFIMLAVNFALGLTFRTMEEGIYGPSIPLLISWLVYFPLMESSAWQGTVGKRILGMRVVGADMQRIPFWRSLVRYIGRYFSSFLFIGFLMVAFDTEKRGLHDRLAGTWVLEVS